MLEQQQHLTQPPHPPTPPFSFPSRANEAPNPHWDPAPPPTQAGYNGEGGYLGRGGWGVVLLSV